MRRLILFSSFAVLFSLHDAFAEPKKAESSDVSLREICRIQECRKNVRVKLTQDDGTEYEKRFELYPASVQRNLVTVLMGEKLFLEVEFEDGKAKSLKSVPENVNPEKTLVLDFSQKPDSKKDSSSYLWVENPFPKPVKFNLEMMTMDGKMSPTSSCPVEAKLKLLEHWPHAIFQLVVTNIRFLGENETKECKI